MVGAARRRRRRRTPRWFDIDWAPAAAAADAGARTAARGHPRKRRDRRRRAAARTASRAALLRPRLPGARGHRGTAAGRSCSTLSTTGSRTGAAADDELNYRRFFDINTLIAVCGSRTRRSSTRLMRCWSRLVERGLVDGLRIDHPDGLADPRGYLRRLARRSRRRPGSWSRRSSSPARTLPADWHVRRHHGLRRAAARSAALFVDPAGGPLLAALRRADRRSRRLRVGRRAGRGSTCSRLAGRRGRPAGARSLRRLPDRAAAARPLAARAREALVELLVGVPVYRAYVVPGEPAAATVGRAVLDGAAAAQADAPTRPRPRRSAAARPRARAARPRRRAGTSSASASSRRPAPAMAKGVEDTAVLPLVPARGARTRSAATRTGSAQRGRAVPRLRRGAGCDLAGRHDRRCRRTTPSAARTFAPGSLALSELPAEWASARARWRAARHRADAPTDGRPASCSGRPSSAPGRSTPTG